MADTGAVLDTVVDIGMSILDTGRIAASTGTLVSGPPFSRLSLLLVLSSQMV